MTLSNAAHLVHGILATEALSAPRQYAIDLLLGPYRSGKTFAIIERILDIHKRDPFSDTIVVVPSARYQALFEQRLVGVLRERASAGSPERGLVGLRIMNFYNLAQMLFRQAGKAFRIVPEQIRPSIIGRVSAALRDNNELKTLSQISSFVGTQQNVLGLIDEFERAALSTGEVLDQVELSAHTDSRYVELAKIYQMYWQELERLNLMDERQVAFALREILSAGVFAPALQNVFVDGFDRFNKLQLQIFAALSQFSKSMTITFDYAELEGKIHPDYVWKESSYAALNSQLQGKFRVQPFETAVARTEPPIEVSRFSVTDRFFEMEEVARRVKHAIVVGKTPPQQILVVARSLKNYGNAIKAAFDDAGLNYFVDEAVEVTKLPIVQFLTGLMKVHGDGLLRRDVISYLRSHYLSPIVGLERWQVDEIDRRSLKYKVVGGRSQWLECFKRHQAGDTPSADPQTGNPQTGNTQTTSVEQEIVFEIDKLSIGEDGSLTDSVPPATGEVNGPDFLQRLQTKLSALFDNLQPLPAATASEHVKWAENLIDRVFAPLFSKQSAFSKRPYPSGLAREWFEDNKEYQRWIEHRAVGEFRRCFSTMLLEEAYLGAQRISAREFVARLERLLSKANFRPVAQVKDAVIICGADLAPNRSFDEVYIAGMVEGEFPRKTTSAGFVGADEIARWESFGIDITNPRFHPGFETALFRNLSGRATKKLHLSYPLHELGGDELLPSILLTDDLPEGGKTEIFSIFTKASALPVSPRNAFAGALSTLGTAASLSQRFEMLDALWSGQSGLGAARLVEQLSENVAMAQGRLSPNRHSVYNGFLTDYVETGALRVTLPERWSATRLGEYGKCGFRFWVSHVLDSEPAEEPQSGLDAKLLGETYHKALELFYKRLIERKCLVTDDSQVVTAYFDEAIDEALEWLQGNGKFRQSEFWHFEKLEVRFRLRRFLSKEIQRAEKDKHQFAPRLLEASFGSTRDPNSFEPLVIKDGARDIGIVGIIDRIDLSSTDSGAPLIRLVDYKKGSSLISADEAYKGRNLQLALYALAVERAILPKAKVVEGVYLSVSSGAPIGKLKFGIWEKSDDPEKPKVLDRTEQYVREYVHGIEKGNFAVEPNGLDLCKRCRHKPVCRISELDVPSNLET